MPTIAEPSPRGFHHWKMAHWCAVWMATFVSAATCWRVQCFQLSSARRELVELERICQPLVEAETQLAEIGARSAAISRRDVAVEQLRPLRQPTTLLGVIGRATANQIAVEDLQFTLEDGGPLHLKALGGDDESVNGFVNGLQSSAEFSSIQLQSVAPRVATEAREFRVEGRLN